ncbi:MAG: hypothetical protein NTW96_21185 [Planctomycetia bacterium]|nr:hypothetical protein [Planctomycetia bacterium]
MTTTDKFREILQRLLEKSKAGKINWRETHPGEFSILFADGSIIAVRYDSPRSGPDMITADLLIAGAPVVSVQSEDGDEDWELLSSLHFDAELHARGWNSAFGTIEKALQSNETIGWQK